MSRPVKKVMGVLLSLAMVISLLTAVAMPACAAYDVMLTFEDGTGTFSGVGTTAMTFTDVVSDIVFTFTAKTASGDPDVVYNGNSDYGAPTRGEEDVYFGGGYTNQSGTITIQDDMVFTLNSFYLSNQGVDTAFVITTSKGGSYTTASVAVAIASTQIMLPAEPGFQGITWFTIAPLSDATYMEIDDIALTDIVPSDIAPNTAPTAGFGTAMAFDGSRLAEITHAASYDIANSFTIEFWLKLSDLTRSQYLVSRNGAGNAGRQWAAHYSSAGYVQFYTGNGITYSPGSQGNLPKIPIEDNHWHHVAFTYDGVTFSAYKDGVLTGSYSTVFSLPTNTDNIYIGGTRGGGGSLSDFAYAELDEVRIWNTCRTYGQLNANMYQGAAFAASGLALYCRFEEGSGSTVTEDVTGGSGSVLNSGGITTANRVDSVAQVWTTDEGISVSGYLIGSDADGDALTYSVVINGAKGATAITPGTNRFTYTPDAHLNGSDSFTYRVTDAHGAESSPQTVNITITPVDNGPSVTAVSPVSGPATGGTTVTITGTDFTGATAVTFGGIAAPSYTVDSATQITATAPVHAVGVVDVKVTTPVGTGTGAGLFTYNAVAPGAPVIGTATAGDKQAAVSFTAPDFTGGSMITGYTVTANPGGLTGTGTVSPIPVTGLTNGTAYTFTVTATNGAGTGSASGASNSVTPSAPSAVTNVTASPQNGIYKLGDIISIQVVFSSAVTVDTTGGLPTLVLNSGGTATYASGSVTNSLTFTYTVGPGQSTNDLDYPSTSALSLNGAIIQAGGSSAVLILPAPGATNSLGANTDIIIDTTVPTVASVTVPAEGTYKAGDTLTFTVNFVESVTVDTAGGRPRIAVTLDSGTVYADYVSGSGTTALTFSYTVQSGHADTNGIVVGSLSLNGGSFTDAAGNDAVLVLNSIGSTAGILIDAVLPIVTVSSLTVSEGATAVVDGGRLNANDTGDITYTVTALPVNGELQKSGDALAAGGTFTQAEINTSYITYTHNGGETASDNFTFSVSDGVNTVSGQTFSITVTPVNDAPEDIALSRTSVEATATGPGAEFATLSATDPDDASDFVYTLVAGEDAAHNGLFSISGASLRTNGTMPSGSYSIRVQVADSGGATYQKSFTLTVTDTASITLTADTTNNSVDNNLEITFPENPAFQNAITGVSFNGTPLIVTTDYAVTAGRLTLKPSGGNPALQTRATGAVVITATGYADFSVSQTITAGEVDSLVVTTQPVPAVESGDVFSTQPEVTLKDQYGNTCADGPSASASVTAFEVHETGSWTLGGTALVAAIDGVATFSGLSCEILTSGTGKIGFDCGRPSTVSDEFTIPEPNSSISPHTASFDRYESTAGYQDIAVTLALNGNTFIAVKNGAHTLVLNSDYTVSGNTLTLKKEYLKTLSTGGVSLTFDFSLGLDRMLVLTVTDSTPSSGGGGSGNTNTGAEVIVNGQPQTAGTSATGTNASGQTVTTVTVDTGRLENILTAQGSGATVTIPVTNGSDVAAGTLTGTMVKSMEEKAATLVIQTNAGSYTLPAAQINIDAVSQQLGASVTLADINVTVSISEPPASMVQLVENAAQDGGFTIMAPAVDYTITCTYGNQAVSVSSFNAYVERTIAIPSGVDPTRITTGVVIDPDGTVHHVPTRITVIDGKYYAVINSLTNSIYSVIWNPVAFSDVTGHWAKDAINNMGSRMVVTEVGNNQYAPGRSMTRAEFAAIMVRALGLEPGNGASGFSDVASTDWCGGYVKTAVAYGIIKGYDDGSFRPNDTITREQAMTMLVRAMKITGLYAGLTDNETDKLLGAYLDGSTISTYAKESIAACLKTGITSGTSATMLSPKAAITRAEVAVMVQRLLQKSGLI